MKKLRGQTADIEIEEEDGTSIPIGILDSPEVAAPNQNVEELRGAGSTKWQDLQKTATHVEVSGEVSAFDLDAWDRLVDYDPTNGELDDSADVATFTVTVIYEASDGSTKTIPVVECYVDDSIPLGGGRDEWIGMDLSFRGRDLGQIDNTDASA